MIISCLFILIGLLLLIYGADIFIVGVSSIARQFGISPLIVGLLFVGVATSAPEVIVGIISALQDKTSIAIGNALGSNITNIGLVFGFSVLIFPILITSDTLKKEYGLMCLSFALGVILMFDQYLGRLDGLILLIALCLFLWRILYMAKNSHLDDPLNNELIAELENTGSINVAIIKFIGGLFLLLLGSHLLVKGAVFVATHFGLSDIVIGLTIVAIGTSLPELAASISCMLKKEADIAIGNIIGSNIFNILLVLGAPILIKPATFELAVLTRDIPFLGVLFVFFGLVVFLTKKSGLIRLAGAVLFFSFCSYQFLLYKTSFL